MPQEAKVKFMQELKGKHGAEAVLAHAIDTLKSYERTTERYAFNGEFRPLEFWRLKGYSVDRIKENALPHEKMTCRLAGEVYKVPIKMESKLTDIVRERQEEFKGKRNARLKRNRDPLDGLHLILGVQQLLFRLFDFLL